MASEIAARPVCGSCGGSKRQVCFMCKGSKESKHIGVETCELCEADGTQTCGVCEGAGTVRAESFEQVLAWYAQGDREFSKSELVAPEGGGLQLHRELPGINLSHSRLSGFRFAESNFSNARFIGVIFDGTHASSCKLVGANFAGAQLAGSDLGYSDLSGADLSSADLSKATLRRANLRRADARGTRLSGANLNQADLRDVRFDGKSPISGSSSAADLSGALLIDANLTGAVLTNASLEDADLRKAKGLSLDANYIKGARFSPGAPDLWSVLRRTYTGPMFAFHLLVLVFFLMPYVLRTVYWAVVNDAQGLLADSIGSVAARAAGVAVSPPLEALLASVQNFPPCLAPTCQQLPIWQVLIGLDGGYANALLPVSLLLYNACRALLTLRVSLLREEEERSGYAPALASFAWMRPVHVTYSVLLVVALSALVRNAWAILTLPVWVRA